ncbi:MAG: thioredoxin-disulfide reductase [Synergistales bacterium]|nr:thioredoxin-disulfide reductase [Synergistales bacterium]MDY6401676.1 thioredoxin-disulfide reductase [Synergistales bacterium]MDY6404244.1 thioredoxin-disulfide reductase [Synergistales bacterium]MDY6411242.1 thioredoxin-disulfide reductase [Synergistales bacterium]MDY6415028.1 thioredoxin-disulfide reductase [Synergistales bacterium]
MERHELVIIGAGPAGMSAAIYGRRAGLDVLVLERAATGGQINITDEIENYPGVAHATGPELGEMLKNHALKFNTEIRMVDSSKVELRGDKKIVITKKGGATNEIEAEAIIVATGAHFRRLGCEGEAEHIGQGVSFCAVCDGAFFEDLEVAVVGGGNTAVEEGGYLTKFASKVYIIHRRDEFRADRAAIAQALANPKIEPIYNTVVEKIEGDGMVENLVLKNVRTGEISNLAVAGVFMFVGQEPDDECVRGLVKAEKGGWIITNDHMETSVEGIFAAGDVRSKYLRQVITAAADGAVAAMAASSYINEQLHLRSTLLEPDEVKAFFYSSIDEAQVKLSNVVESAAKAKGVKVPVIDGYRNARMTEKLGLADKLPAIAEIKKGVVEKVTTLKSESDVESALR